MKDKKKQLLQVKYSGSLYHVLSFEFDINKIMIGTIDNNKPTQMFSVDSNDIEFILN